MPDANANANEPAMPDKPDRHPETFPDNLLPLLFVLLIVGGAVAYGFIGHWRRASVAVGVAMAVAGVLRLVLPRHVAGLLVVRRKSFDVLVYLGLALAILVVAFVVPPA